MQEQDTIEHPPLTPTGPPQKMRGASMAGSELARRVWVLALLAALTLMFAAAAGSTYGWPAAAAVIAVVTTFSGLTKALVDLHVVFEKRAVEVLSTDELPRRRRRPLLAAIIGLSFFGVLAGYLLVPSIAEFSTRPVAGIAIPAEVNAVQPVRLYWHNLTADDEIRVLVREQGDTTNFIAPCHGGGARFGEVACEVDVGGQEDAGRWFEVRVVRIPRKIGEQITATSAQDGYLRELPNEAVVLASRLIQRK